MARCYYQIGNISSVHDDLIRVNPMNDRGYPSAGPHESVGRAVPVEGETMQSSYALQIALPSESYKDHQIRTRESLRKSLTQLVMQCLSFQECFHFADDKIDSLRFTLILRADVC